MIRDESQNATDDVPLVAVAALARNGAIGRAGGLPFTMPGDLARFRALTMGTPMIMGRRTWDSIGRPLPGRESLVVTRDPSLDLPQGVWRSASPEDALRLAQTRAAAMGAASVSLIGGAALFGALLDRVDRLALTFVDLAPDGDTFFPPIDPAAWQEVSRIVPQRHSGDEAACTFVDYVRISVAA
ncbi:Dihydrofolate reductase type 3 [Beijerinckiaceae bacterium RH AL1]|nr:dihydrofolate reductase [Beijerinckiaceae bacterium]VVB46235.1 Dihydrofolate reductase type 3 [Beijerinckiaceae bacterium RH CH11]VVB46320.1 Dihydrofolate reductase type 3 [Beijerinckiaceae bacterium RH AL8]VVC55272.1 Dihydrofolate reductase type 3 [Beijerinckiaceae bacterium RH AL1]